MTTKMYVEPDLIKEDYAGCCGIDIFTGLSMEEGHPNYYSKEVLCTKEEWHKKALNFISRNRECRHVQLSFVTKYKDVYKGDPKEQCPGFKDFLLTKGWYIIDEFVAPRHGNKVCVMGKTFRGVPKEKQAFRGYGLYNW